jgi:hypothetical protein
MTQVPELQEIILQQKLHYLTTSKLSHHAHLATSYHLPVPTPIKLSFLKESKFHILFTLFLLHTPFLVLPGLIHCILANAYKMSSLYCIQFKNILKEMAHSCKNIWSSMVLLHTLYTGLSLKLAGSISKQYDLATLGTIHAGHIMSYGVCCNEIADTTCYTQNVIL